MSTVSADGLSFAIARKGKFELDFHFAKKVSKQNFRIKSFSSK